MVERSYQLEYTVPSSAIAAEAVWMSSIPSFVTLSVHVSNRFVRGSAEIWLRHSRGDQRVQATWVLTRRRAGTRCRWLAAARSQIRQTVHFCTVDLSSPVHTSTAIGARFRRQR